MSQYEQNRRNRMEAAMMSRIGSEFNCRGNAQSSARRRRKVFSGRPADWLILLILEFARMANQ
jgi:hypothetical protein